MHPLPHGYTNRTMADSTHVTKTYQGPDAATRLRREADALTTLRPHLPVPTLKAVHQDTLTLDMERVPGTQGQDLIAKGHAPAVLSACGHLLRRLHQIPTADGTVIVHGDFGPNNTLLDPDTFAVTALLDWEFVHRGDPIEDLAWCEWIIRTHHPERSDALADFHAAYAGPIPTWPDRQAEMLRRCRELEEFCHRWQGPGEAVRTWQTRADKTSRWTE